MNMQVSANVQQASLEAVVIRCGCGHPESHPGTVCPTPRAIEDRGTIAYYHRDPLRLWAWKMQNKLKEFKNKWIS